MGTATHILSTIFLYLLGSVIYHPTDKGVPGQTLACKHACAIVCVQTCVPSCSSSFAFNKHRAGGQRALLYIRSASSNSKRHQRPPVAILCVAMRWRAQLKLVMSVGSESRLSSARLCSASQNYSSLSAMAISLVFVGYSQPVCLEHLWRSAPPPADIFLVVLLDSTLFYTMTRPFSWPRWLCCDLEY